MRNSLTVILAAMQLVACQQQTVMANEGPFHVGQLSREIHPVEQRHWRGASGQFLAARVWYPVDAAVPMQPHHIGPPGIPFFVGHPLSPDAAVSAQERTYPLILMSHGTGGNADNMDWIAAPLATEGYIVVAVDHPGNSAPGVMSWDGFNLWWERATDLSDVIDAVLADPVLGPRVDHARIGALGFSLGGYTVLEIAGARTDVTAFHRFCSGPDADAVCHPPEMDRVKEPKVPLDQRSPASQASIARAGASYRDSRVKSVFAIAPALGQALSPKSLEKIDIPVALLAGTADINVPPRSNLEYIAGFLPKAETTMVPKAGHYTFLSVCAAAMKLYMPELCAEPEGSDRAKAHDVAVTQAKTFFGKTLRRQGISDISQQ